MVMLISRPPEAYSVNPKAAVVQIPSSTEGYGAERLNHEGARRFYGALRASPSSSSPVSGRRSGRQLRVLRALRGSNVSSSAWHPGRRALQGGSQPGSPLPLLDFATAWRAYLD